MSTNIIAALGADVKSKFLVAKGKKIYEGPSLGDLSDADNYESFKKAFASAVRVVGKPGAVVYDLHPGYFSRQFAEQNRSLFSKNTLFFPVQHHHAHIASVLAENRELKRVIGVSFDGTGYGSDGNMWGGEFLSVEKGSFVRLAHLKYRMMPGGDKVVREPWRMVVSILGDKAGYFLKKIKKDDMHLILAMMRKNINAPLTSSAGRLFDAAAALLGICQHARFEAEGPIKLEAMCWDDIRESYNFKVSRTAKPCIIDTDALFAGMAQDLKNGMNKQVVATKFHNSIVNIIVYTVWLLSEQSRIKDIVLSGGVFQNKYLMTNVRNTLVSNGFSVYSNKENVSDLNIAMGQYYVSGKAGKN